MQSICGADCAKCSLSNACKGCTATNGRPFGAECVLASCYRKGENALDACKRRLIAAFNALDIRDMEEVTELNALKGSFLNIEYALPNGMPAKFWDDDKIYFGNQLHKKDSDRCYGIAADEKYLMVSEYGGSGSDPEIVVFRRWN